MDKSDEHHDGRVAVKSFVNAGSSKQTPIGDTTAFACIVSTLQSE